MSNLPYKCLQSLLLSSTKKLDQGLKALLRGFRDRIIELFDSCLNSNGTTFAETKHNCSEAELLRLVEYFMLTVLGITSPSLEDVWCVTLIVYSSKGCTQKKKDSCTSLKVVGEELMGTFYHIFTKPNATLLKQFIASPLMDILWTKAARTIAYDNCFKPKIVKGSSLRIKGKPKEKILVTYFHITKIFEDASMPLPKWWAKLFPASGLP